MEIYNNIQLANFTSFGTGGPADKLVLPKTVNQIMACLKSAQSPVWILGDGANVLISDQGLPGTVLRPQIKSITSDEAAPGLLIAEAGATWDDLVQSAISEDLWGLECTSGIPGSVGAAVVGNIAAYGQAVADTLSWVEVLDIDQPTNLERLTADQLGLSYRYSDFQTKRLGRYLIVRAAFQLQPEPTKNLSYASALRVASELQLDTGSLTGRRQIILEARRRAGSLIIPGQSLKTAGSFFRNPLVSQEQAAKIIAHEENSISLEQIYAQNAAHSGEGLRVSAAHVLLAAGFYRGQSWGPVRLHPDHVLKIENTNQATSQQIYDVAQHIITTVKLQLGVNLEPEVRFMGHFNS